MWRLVSRRVGAALVSALLISTAVAQQPAQELSWAEKMFSDLTIDFGTILIQQPGEVRLTMKVRSGQATVYLKGLRLIRE